MSELGRRRISQVMTSAAADLHSATRELYRRETSPASSDCAGSGLTGLHSEDQDPPMIRHHS